MATITYKSASCIYEGSDKLAVDSLNLDITDGEFVVLVGPSGSGKSTALRMLAGLEDIDEGAIEIGGKDMTGVPSKDRDIAMVFQNYALYPNKTVAENMGFALKLRGVSAADRRKKVERLVLCTGKIFWDIDASERREAAEDVAIARVELLYPFAKQQLSELIASYPNLKEIVWAQEEPRNMGCWKVMSRRLPDLMPEGVELGYVGRPTRASPGEGYSVAHAREQERVVLTALTPGA